MVDEARSEAEVKNNVGRFRSDTYVCGKGGR